MDLFQFSSRSSAMLIFLFLAAVLTAGCSSSAESKKGDKAGAEKEKSNDAPVKITLGKAEAREIPTYFAVTGSLAADETSDVAPKTAGKVVRTFVEVGAFVRQGDVIAKLDDSDALLRVREARSGVVQAQAGVAQAQAGVAQAQARLGLSNNGSFQSSTIPEVRAANANLEQFQAELKQAEANENRYRDLVQTGDVSSQVYEGYRTARDTARARVNNARQQLEAAVNSAKQNNQAVKSAQAAV